jgi:hypothetical protein
MTSTDARRRAAGLAFGLALAACAPARAALGGDAASIEEDRARLAAQHVVATMSRPQGQVTAQAQPQPQVQEHRLVLADGSTVREFAVAGGRVFAVSWSTRLKPRLDALLGAQSDRYAAAARRALLVPGARHALSFDEGDLVVHATTRLNSNVGTAYLRSLVPAGLSIDAIR